MKFEDSRVDSFAHRLEIAMKKNNINQIELSEKTKNYEKTISQSLINKYLKGKAFARQNNIYILCKILNVDEAWIMGFDVPMERTPDEYRNQENIEKYTTKDDSMLPLLGLYDIAYIYKQNTYISGETILFTLDNKEFIRKIINNNNIIEFHAMNPYYPIMKYSKEELEKKDFEIIGKVIKVENKSAFK